MWECTQKEHAGYSKYLQTTLLLSTCKKKKKFKTPSECHVLRQQVKEAAQKHSTSTMRCLGRCVVIKSVTSFEIN